MAAYRYLVAGRVQGVGFRYFVFKRATELGLAGFTRNLPDGRVEVVAEGQESSLTDLEALLRAGPSFASVQTLERTELQPRGDQGFHIR